MIETYLEQNVNLEDENRNKKKKLVLKIVMYINLIIGIITALLLTIVPFQVDGEWMPVLLIISIVMIPVLFIASFFLFRHIYLRINLEFDYVLNGNRLIVVKVINHARRKKFLEFDINELSEIGKVTLPSYEHQMAGKPKEYNACANLSDDNYYVVAKHNGEKCILYTEFNNEFLSAIFRSLGRNILVKK